MPLLKRRFEIMVNLKLYAVRQGLQAAHLYCHGFALQSWGHFFGCMSTFMSAWMLRSRLAWRLAVAFGRSAVAVAMAEVSGRFVVMIADVDGTVEANSVPLLVVLIAVGGFCGVPVSPRLATCTARAFLYTLVVRFAETTMLNSAATVVAVICMVSVLGD